MTPSDCFPPDALPAADPVSGLAEARSREEAPRGGAIDPDPYRLIHELQVHQFELEMQNQVLAEARNAAEDAQARYAALYEFAPVGFVTLDRDGVIVQANQVATATLSLAGEQIGRVRLGAFIAEESLSVFNGFLAASLHGGAGGSCEAVLRPAEGRSGIAIVTLETRRASDGAECNVAMVDITRRRQTERLLARHSRYLQILNNALVRSNAELLQARLSMERMAMHDQLTGLATRYKFLETYAIEVERRNRTGSSLSLLVIDVDHFKRVNDRLGHLAGDVCLRTIASVLVRSVRAADLVGRFGGEEFVVLLPESDAEGAMAAADNLCKEIRSTSIRVGTEALSLTISIGIATLRPGQQGDFDLLMQRADQAVYAAKLAGRDAVARSVG